MKAVISLLTLARMRSESYCSCIVRLGPLFVRLYAVRRTVSKSKLASPSFDFPTPAQLKRARKGKAWNRGYVITVIAKHLGFVCVASYVRRDPPYGHVAVYVYACTMYHACMVDGRPARPY